MKGKLRNIEERLLLRLLYPFVAIWGYILLLIYWEIIQGAIDDYIKDVNKLHLPPRQPTDLETTNRHGTDRINPTNKSL